MNAGADRLELCGNLGLGGGTTPSLGLLKAVRKAVAHTPATIVVSLIWRYYLSDGVNLYRQTMVRPRTGDFLYTPEEFNIILEDIKVFKQAGAHGIVCGVLKADGTVDVARTER